jgi:hypothetical protein
MAREATALPFDKITSASPETLGLWMLETDLHAARLDQRTRLAAVSAALADGAATARSL